MKVWPPQHSISDETTDLDFSVLKDGSVELRLTNISDEITFVLTDKQRKTLISKLSTTTKG
jgi:hypothetical protein